MNRPNLQQALPRQRIATVGDLEVTICQWSHVEIDHWLRSEKGVPHPSSVALRSNLVALQIDDGSVDGIIPWLQI